MRRSAFRPGPLDNSEARLVLSGTATRVPAPVSAMASTIMAVHQM